MWRTKTCKQEYEWELENGWAVTRTIDMRKGNKNKWVSLSHFPPFKVSILTKCKEHGIRGLGLRLQDTEAWLCNQWCQGSCGFWGINVQKRVSYKELGRS